MTEAMMPPADKPAIPEPNGECAGRNGGGGNGATALRFAAARWYVLRERRQAPADQERPEVRHYAQPSRPGEEDEETTR